MENDTTLFIWIIIWIVSFVFITRASFQKRTTPSVGLVIAFISNFSLLHLFGALIYTFPWFESTYEPYIVKSGFIQSTIGLIAFGFGCIVVAPFLIRTFRFSWIKVGKYVSNPDLPKVYMMTGFIFYFVLNPILGGIPSIRTLVYSGWNLLIAGICLNCWNLWIMKKREKLIRWLILAVCFPFFTMLMQGFLGMGTAVLLLILIFVGTFYRPRWQIVIAAVLMIYLGLSLFVNYMAIRGELREQIQYGKSMSSRVGVMSRMLSNFEFIDFHNQNHLTAIDSRINENVLAGAAIEYLRDGHEEYARGETILNAIIAVIPRLLWPGKPFTLGGSASVTKYTGITFVGETSVAMSLVMEFYINFGTVGVIIGFMLFGILLKFFDIASGYRLAHGDWQGFVFWFLPGLGFMGNPSLFAVTMTVGSSIVFCIFVNKYILPRFSSKRRLR